LYKPDRLRNKVKARLRQFEIRRRGEWFQDLLQNFAKNEASLRRIEENLSPLEMAVSKEEVEKMQGWSTRKLINFYERLHSERVDVEEATSKIVEELKPLAERIKPFVRDTDYELQKLLARGKKVLLEGAQGLLLSISHGTVPYSTSSDCSVQGLANGVGMFAKDVDVVFGIVKFPFMTRVGGGPFPTELAGREQENYCAARRRTVETELKQYDIPFTKKDKLIDYDPAHPKIIEMINSEDPFIKAAGIRLAAGEFGATTGRPRRIGWTDAVATKYATQKNGKLFILTKPDCLAGAEEFKLCFGYQHGHDIRYDFERDNDYLRSVKPILASFKGYGDLSRVENYKDAAASFRFAVEQFELNTGGKVVMVSNGAERGKMLFKHKTLAEVM
jgi:adenylosuccinate synthase